MNYLSGMEWGVGGGEGVVVRGETLDTAFSADLPLHTVWAASSH